MTAARPYISDEDAHQLLVLVKTHPLFAKGTEEPIEWIPGSDSLVDYAERGALASYDGSPVVRSLVWYDGDVEGFCGFHDTGSALVYDRHVSRYEGVQDDDVRIPGYVHISAIGDYVGDIKSASSRARQAGLKAGRRMGQDAMKQAIRSLIGAAPLFEIEEVA